MDLTVHLLTKNNATTIEKCLASILPLNARIIVGDRGSEDSTVLLCQKYGAEVHQVSSYDLAEARNELIAGRSGWHIYINPWEVLAIGLEKIKELKDPAAYSVQVFQGDIIAKETRIWHSELKTKFIQPIYEILELQSDVVLPGIVLYTLSHREEFESSLAAIESWMRAKPLSPEPYYYKAFALLGLKKLNEFINAGNEYLFRNTVGMPAIMMQYYMSYVHLYHRNMGEAVRGIVKCIVSKPLMSEFWCVLGDIYYQLKYYKRAMIYYENALILGRHRQQFDSYPIEVSKYKSHPEKMILSCRSIIAGSKAFKRQ